MSLFSYCIPIDDGAAPNPYFEICTLTICKPVIRRNAKVGDWIAGVGSKNVDGIDYSGKLVYAMKVTEIKSFQDYDIFCRTQLLEKIPDVRHREYRRRVGDCIYDFSDNPEGKLRPSVHNYKNRETDLGGINALLSDHFYYFGNNAIDIPNHLAEIIHQGQGHKSNANNHLVEPFMKWIEGMTYQPNTLYGYPQMKIDFKLSEDDVETVSCDIRCRSGEGDQEYK